MKTRSMCLPAAVCALFLAAGAGAKEARKPDAWITTKVKSALATHKNVSAFGTHVETKAGFVTLRGKAGSPAERELAAKYAREVEGVRGVDNQIVVKGERGYGSKGGEMGVDSSGRGAGDRILDRTKDKTEDAGDKVEGAGDRAIDGR